MSSSGNTEKYRADLQIFAVAERGSDVILRKGGGGVEAQNTVWRRWIGVWAFLILVVFAAFGAALHGYFIADDLTNLHFIRSYDGSYLDFWVPGRRYSAPVTQSRFMPLHIWHWWALNAAFGDKVWAYHLASFVCHATVASLLVALGRKLGRCGWPVATMAGVLFAAYRLNTQTVVWASANFRLVSTAVFLTALLVLCYGQRFGVTVMGFCALYLWALLMNPDFVVAPLVLGLFAWAAWSVREVAQAKLFACAAISSGIVVATFALANHISNQAFPDSLTFSLWPSPSRFVAFFANIIVPYDVPGVMKVVAVFVVLAFLLHFCDAYGLAFLGAATTIGVFWSVANYVMAPRYLYVPCGFVMIALAQAVERATQTIRFAQLQVAVPAAAVLALVAINMLATHRRDLVHFQYLSTLPQQLAAVSRAAPQDDDLRILVVPNLPLPQADLEFFGPHLRFVSHVDDADVVVGTAAPAFRHRLGNSFDRDYWYLPWFETRPLESLVKPVASLPREKIQYVSLNLLRLFVMQPVSAVWVPLQAHVVA